MVYRILDQFNALVKRDWSPAPEQLETLNRLIMFSAEKGYSIIEEYRSAFIEAVNQKLALNDNAYQEILDAAFLDGTKFNYVQKKKIRYLLDCGNTEGFQSFLYENNAYSERIMKSFCPVSYECTMAALQRIEQTDAQMNAVLQSVFSRFCFNLFDIKCTASFFSGEEIKETDFFAFIEKKYPGICCRSHALTIVDVDPALFSQSYLNGCNAVLSAIEEEFASLDNHCYLSVYIPPLSHHGEDLQWHLYKDVVLFAEKLSGEKIDRAYFRWEKIREQTTEYIKEIDPDKADFSTAFQGFVYKDCFVLDQGIETSYPILLTFEKNVRDERPINCPACFSSNIQGNSYPILNVRSWECQNPLCPDRSKYNRGKRYAFSSLYRQRQMLDDRNSIPPASVAKWHLDCVRTASKADAFEMIVRHYSCIGDGIRIITNSTDGIDLVDDLGRIIQHKLFVLDSNKIIQSFSESSFFHRYVYDNASPIGQFRGEHIGKATVYFGDSFDVLRSLSANSIDAAVTSPPYYNAKAYSHWPNIYCYLYDMYNICKEVFRALKPGSVFLFNIFDYFDNENNIVFSAMGKKRMILGAYLLDIFSRIGFTIVGNIVWDKGEIQGNRSFNQGNMTPYYQAPLNCWEHVFIVSKGNPAAKFEELKSSIAVIRPVIKYVGGKNVLGHDAPYPKDIPELVIRLLNESDTVLDPFLGSGTTSIVANSHGVFSIGVEKSEEYYELCKKQITGNMPTQLSLFS